MKQSMETNPKAQAHPCSPQSAKAAILCQIVGHKGGHGRPGDAASDAWVTIGNHPTHQSSSWLNALKNSGFNCLNRF